MLTRELVKVLQGRNRMSRILIVEDEDLIRNARSALKAEVMRSQLLLMGKPLWLYSEC